MEIIDISLPISPAMAVWPGAPKTEFFWRRAMSKGDRNNNSHFAMNTHAGTHVDAPLHFIKGGEPVETLPLDVLIGRALVLDFSTQREIALDFLQAQWPSGPVDRILFKTHNSQLWRSRPGVFTEDFCALAERETRWLLQKKIRLVGIDALSIQKYGSGPIVHQLLLENKIVIVEGLDLSRVEAGFYELICLPLKLAGLEGAPARVVLRRNGR